MPDVAKQTVEFILDAFKRIFAPRDDDYPAIGVQPFEGVPHEVGRAWH
jgi:hypothetical protein